MYIAGIRMEPAISEATLNRDAPAPKSEAFKTEIQINNTTIVYYELYLT